MKGNKGILLLLLALVVISMITVRAALQVHTPKKETPKVNLEELLSHYPAVDFSNPRPELGDPELRAKRSAKNRRYDKIGSVSSVPVKGASFLGTDWDVGLSGIPVNQSDAAVVGEVLGADAHLSQDKKAVYSEFTVRVEEVLKNNGSNGPLVPGQSITADRFGGVVKYGPEHSRLHGIFGQDLPRVGRRYVLFLKSAGEDQDYSIVLGYELRAGKVFLLDEVQKTAPYKGMDAASFLKAVRAAAGQ